MSEKEIEINTELENTIDQLGEYYFNAFKNMVDGNNTFLEGMKYPKVDEKIAFKSIIGSIVTELLA